jgi:hypothetical protein
MKPMSLYLILAPSRTLQSSVSFKEIIDKETTVNITTVPCEQTKSINEKKIAMCQRSRIYILLLLSGYILNMQEQ